MGVHGENYARYTSVLMPMECNYLLFPVMPRVCHETSFRRARGAIVRVISLGTTTLFGFVIRLCGESVEGRTWMDRAHPTAAPHFAERPDQIAVPFCLPYRVWRPLEERCDGVDCQAAEEAVAARDVLRIFFCVSGLL
ncbi:hypothetical protein TcCL_NonESM12653 [Trypanosoma cruzi]|nr:hypothetical protein TcCL_NonESM12653 [Trypanosoma cruzi]